MENDLHVPSPEQTSAPQRHTPESWSSVTGTIQWHMTAPIAHISISQFLTFWCVTQSHFKMYQGSGYLRKPSNKFFNTSTFLECELITNLSSTPGILYNHGIKCVNLCQNIWTRYTNLCYKLTSCASCSRSLASACGYNPHREGV